jgi:uncharacterized RDD family membrane protein YckC
MTNGAMYCNRCGAQNSALAKFCANCGSPFAGESPATVAAEPAIVPRPQGPVQPPAYPTPSGTTAPFPTQAVRYGGFWIRFVAVLIDAIVVGIVVWPLSAVIALVIGIAGSTVAMPSAGVHLVRVIVAIGLNTCANWLYEASFESSSKQATLGKMMLGLKVTDLKGCRISFARATGRHFAKILSGMILLIGYIMAGFTERKQALHDMIAGTLVQRTL